MRSVGALLFPPRGVRDLALPLSGYFQGGYTMGSFAEWAKSMIGPFSGRLSYPVTCLIKSNLELGYIRVSPLNSEAIATLFLGWAEVFLSRT
jgi:hypothetical protein